MVAARHGTTSPGPWAGAALRWSSAVSASALCWARAIGDAYSGSTAGLLQGRDVVPSLLITVAASVAISFFFYSRGKAAYLQAHMAQAQRDATEARLKLLEAQLEPHMMFNTLANLRVLIATDPPRAQAMLDHLIAYLRATLGGARTTLHPLADEFDRLRDYLELMAVRMGPRLAYTLDLPEGLQSTPVPPLLLQPLVENAIRHGLEPQVEGGHITVRASTQPRRDAARCWSSKCTTPGQASRRHRQPPTTPAPARALAWPRCASAWPRCTARRELLN